MRSGTLIIWYTACIHWIWGILLLSSSAPLTVTAIYTMTQLGLVQAPHLGILYLMVSFAATIGLATPHDVRPYFLMPQQLALGISSYGALRAMWLGAFADGVLRPSEFLVADQIYMVLLMLFHMIAVITLSREDPS